MAKGNGNNTIAAVKNKLQLQF